MLCVHSLPSSLLVFLPAVQTQPELLSYISLAPHSLFFRSYLWEKSTLSRGRMNGGRREVAVVRGGIFCGPDSFCRGPVHCNNVLCHDHDKPWTLPGARERAPTPLKFSLSLSSLPSSRAGQPHVQVPETNAFRFLTAVFLPGNHHPVARRFLRPRFSREIRRWMESWHVYWTFFFYFFILKRSCDLFGLRIIGLEDKFLWEINLSTVSFYGVIDYQQ